MVTLYLLCLFLGTVALVVLFAARGSSQGVPAPQGSAPRARNPALDEEVVPGARIEPSDDYAVEGGTGGAEGEGAAPEYRDGADGGVGGAEGCAVAGRGGTGWSGTIAFLSSALLGFGGTGYLLDAAEDRVAVTPIVVGLLLGVLGWSAARFFAGEREADRA
jgi:hypothetical protein